MSDHDVYLQTKVDDSIFIWIECKGRPAISIDINNPHGRRCLGIRVEGMSTFSCLLDVADIGPLGSGRPQRFCSECGAKRNLFSSRGHVCPETLPLDTPEARNGDNND